MEYELVREYNIEQYDEFCELMQQFKGGDRTADVTGRAVHILLEALENKNKLVEQI